MRWMLLVFGVLLYSCGGGGSSNSPAPVVTPPPTTPPPTTPPPTTGGTQNTLLEDAAAEFAGLAAQDFLEVSYRFLLSRYPESVLDAGLEQEYQLTAVELDNISPEYRALTLDLVELIATQAETYNHDDMPDDLRVSFLVYQYYLQDFIQGAGFDEFDFPGTHFITSIESQTRVFFTDIHPVRNEEEVEDYITRLSLIGDKFDDLVLWLRVKEQTGVVAPSFTYQWAGSRYQGFINSHPRATPYYAALEAKTAELTGLSATRRNELLAQAENTIAQVVLPAYQALLNQVNRLANIAPNDGGVGQFSGGDDFYRFALRHHTSTDLDAQEIHQLGLTELQRIHAEMRELFDELGYPSDESIPESFQRLAKDDELIPAHQVVGFHEALIDAVYDRLDEAFSEIPSTEVVVIGVDAGGFYIAGNPDGTRPAAFYASAGESQSRYQLPSLTYHETVPGHHLQIAIARELDLPVFRRIINFTGFAEGWALYAERLAFDLGWYEEDPSGNLGRLQWEAFRAARLVVDTGIHTMGWQAEEAARFFDDNTGFGIDYARGQIARYQVWPGQATAYMVGMLKFLELREMAQSRLGDRFRLEEFHSVVLGNGSTPFTVLEQIVEQYIESVP
jgi:uncharacterized protein (DUF885 family)